jgi:hypothetical protein
VRAGLTMRPPRLAFQRAVESPAGVTAPSRARRYRRNVNDSRSDGRRRGGERLLQSFSRGPPAAPAAPARGPGERAAAGAESRRPTPAAPRRAAGL